MFFYCAIAKVTKYFCCEPFESKFDKMFTEKKMIDFPATLFEVSKLPVGLIITQCQFFGIDIFPFQSDESIQLQYMRILSVNKVLNDLDHMVLQNQRFCRNYLNQDVGSVLQREYFLEKIRCFSHLEKVLLLSSLEENDSEHTGCFLALLGEKLSLKKLEILITSSIMSQYFLNDLLKRTPGCIVDILEEIIEDYGFCIPQPLVLFESIWCKIFSECELEEMYSLSRVSCEMKSFVLKYLTTFNVETKDLIPLYDWVIESVFANHGISAILKLPVERRVYCVEFLRNNDKITKDEHIILLE